MNLSPAPRVPTPADVAAVFDRPTLAQRKLAAIDARLPQMADHLQRRRFLQSQLDRAEESYRLFQDRVDGGMLTPGADTPGAWDYREVIDGLAVRVARLGGGS